MRAFSMSPLKRCCRLLLLPPALDDVASAAAAADAAVAAAAAAAAAAAVTVEVDAELVLLRIGVGCRFCSLRLLNFSMDALMLSESMP